VRPISLQLLRAICRLPPLSTASRDGSRARTRSRKRQANYPADLPIPYLPIPTSSGSPARARPLAPAQPRFPANAAPYARGCRSQIPPSCRSPRARRARRARPAARRDSPPRFSANAAPYARVPTRAIAAHTSLGISLPTRTPAARSHELSANQRHGAVIN
jgi:hypothetical protein